MKYYIASCSFGKDSLAMVLRLIEENKPLDEVVFYDTGMEFQAIYNVRDKLLPLLAEKGIKYTELKPDRPFLYDMLEKPVESKQKGKHNGYGWHISNLVIYDKPKELSEFYVPVKDYWETYDPSNYINGCWQKPLQRPPQSWCYVEGVIQNDRPGVEQNL